METPTIEKPSPVRALNEKIRKEILEANQTHVALLNFQNLETAATLRDWLGKNGCLSVITETDTITTIVHENVELGDRIPTEDGSDRYHAKSEAVMVSTQRYNYHGILMVNSRKVRKALDKVIGTNVTWATREDSLKHLDEMDERADSVQ